MKHAHTRRHLYTHAGNSNLTYVVRGSVSEAAFPRQGVSNYDGLKTVAILAQAPILAQDQKYLGPGHAQPAILLPATRRIGRLLNGLSIPEACARC